uniref:Uncharacterized protein n=1 Tax=Arundo donax TaxID=35708 RepID=A0A0A9EAG2_ARUDO
MYKLLQLITKASMKGYNSNTCSKGVPFLQYWTVYIFLLGSKVTNFLCEN